MYILALLVALVALVFFLITLIERARPYAISFLAAGLAFLTLSWILQCLRLTRRV